MFCRIQGFRKVEVAGKAGWLHGPDLCARRGDEIIVNEADKPDQIHANIASGIRDGSKEGGGITSLLYYWSSFKY